MPMPGDDPILAELRRALEDGDLIVFAGPGVSMAAGLPGPRQLAAELLATVRARDPASPYAPEMAALIDRGRIPDALSAARLALGAAPFGHAVERALTDEGRDVPEIARAVAARRDHR